MFDNLEKEITDLEARAKKGEDVEKELIAKDNEFNKLAEREKKRIERKALKTDLASVSVGVTQDEKISKGMIFKDDGHFYHDVYTAGPRGESESEALKRYSKTVGSDEMATTGSNEGYLIPTEQRNTLIQRIRDYGIVRSRAFDLPLSVPSVKVPAVNDKTDASEVYDGGIQVYFKAEKAQLTASKPDFRKVQLSCNKLTALVYATDELLRFSPISIAAFINQSVPRAIAAKEDKTCLTGNGAGEPLGMFAAANAARIGTTRNTGSHIKYADVCLMWARAFGKNRSGWVWVANDSVLPDLMQMSFEGTSSSVAPSGWGPYVPAGAMGQTTDTLLGKQVLYSSFMSTLGTSADIGLAYIGDYYFAHVGGLESATSIHLRFDYDETAFRFIEFIDGQPSWDSVFTPYAGSTLSPFIIIAA